MNSSKLVCRAAIFVQTVNFMLILMNRNKAANFECMPITVDTLEEIKRDQTENSSPTFLECVVFFTEFVCANTIFFLQCR